MINLAIVGGRPRTLSLKRLLECYVDHRKDVIRRRTRFLKRKAEERKHIVEGLRIAVGNIDEVVRIIRKSANTDDAKRGLMSAFTLSPAQAQAIVDMRLGRLTGLEREKLEAEFNQLVAEIADLDDILEREARVVAIIREDIDDLEKRYGDARRSEISSEEVEGSFDIEELITEELMVVTFSRGGYVKRVPLETYRAQSRGGRGVKGSEAREGDVLRSIFVASTHDYVLFFSNKGKVYWLKVYQIPEGSRTGQGRSIQNLLPLEEGEVVSNLLRVRAFDNESFVFFATRQGTVKKTKLEAFSRPKKGGIWAILLEEGDEVVGVRLARPGDTILLCSAKGQAIRFDEKAVRSMGRTSYGVRGMRLLDQDRVVSLIVAGTQEASVITACQKGFGKRTPLSDYPIKGRGGQGVINVRGVDRNGLVVGMDICRDEDDVMFVTASGMIVRSPVQDMRPMGRATQGVRLVNLKSEDELVAIEVVSAQDIDEYAREEAALPRPSPGPALAEDEDAHSDAEEDEDEERDADDTGDADEDSDA
jgi:DNA gyrase subunit A